MNRRIFVKQSALVGAGVFLSKYTNGKSSTSEFPIVRTPGNKRKFNSKAVERVIEEVKTGIGNREIAWMFENCFPNTLDTTVDFTSVCDEPDTYVITGDIDAMWLRDSSLQVAPYLSLCKEDKDLQQLIKGVIGRQTKCIIKDPYANAFYKDENRISEWQKDDTKMLPGVHERKWEIDSLCYPIWLSYKYWRETGDASIFTEKWYSAMNEIVSTFLEQQRLLKKGGYSFMRNTKCATDTVPLSGYGNPGKPNGLIFSMFRPSDDATIFPFLIPSNLFAYECLQYLLEITNNYNKKFDFKRVVQLSKEIDENIDLYGKINTLNFREIYAYEVNGYGSYNLMDDANVPSLLAIPYLMPRYKTDETYRHTRKFVLSDSNPFYFRGKTGDGIGSPHTGLDYIWTIGIIMRGMTSEDNMEIKNCIDLLTNTHANSGFMHESFHKDDATKFTRSWFAMANSLFGEFILKIYREKPSLLS